MRDHLAAIRAGLEYASEAFSASPTSNDVEWRKADDAMLTAAWEAWEALDERADKLRAYLDEGLAMFAKDPPDTRFQEGYRAALAELRRVAEQEGWL